MSYGRQQAEELILQACRELITRGLIARTWGNVSARIDNDEFIITPSGRRYEDLTADDLVTVKIKDLSWDEKSGKKPSSEKNMHAAIYKLRHSCDFIIHTHQTNASAVSILGEDFLFQKLPESIATQKERMILGDMIPCAEYGLSSTRKLTRNVAKEVKKHPQCHAVLMRHHGAVCFGQDYEDVFQIADALENVCGKIYEKKCGEKILIDEANGSPFADIKKGRGGYYLHLKTPYVMEMSRRGKTVMPYLDDMAQIGGLSTKCVDRDFRPKDLKAAMKGRSAAFIKNSGAVCIADTPDEVQAVALVMEKNCQAANLGLKKAKRPVDSVSARLERTVYLKKYSKLSEVTE